MVRTIQSELIDPMPKDPGALTGSSVRWNAWCRERDLR